VEGLLGKLTTEVVEGEAALETAAQFQLASCKVGVNCVDSGNRREPPTAREQHTAGSKITVHEQKEVGCTQHEHEQKGRKHRQDYVLAVLQLRL